MMKQWLSLATILIVLVAANAAVLRNGQQAEAEGPTVHLKDGIVRGAVIDALDDRKVNFFQGIRFGRAKRFQKPTPSEAWNGTYEAIEQRGSCPQIAEGQFIAPDMTISEDCLFVNVWQPISDSPNKTQSVMVWIYGGAYQQGTIFSDIYNARHISAIGNVVVVSLNYRLGPLGFASFGTKEAPGNLGLHDQILGLKWVQENVAQFDGNPADVTIFGESAGSMSVGALVLSPLTTGLFHRAIMQSGAPNSRLFETEKSVQNRTMRFAKGLGCQVTDLPSAMKCLETKTPKELVKTSTSDFSHLDSFGPLYGDEVLPEDPWKMLDKFDRDLDLVFGVVRNEGTLFMGGLFPHIDMVNITYGQVNKDINEMFAKINAPAKESKMVLDYYTKHLTENSTQDELRVAISDILGDYALVCPTILFGETVARRMAQKPNNTNRFYSYRVMLPITIDPSPWQPWMGVAHAEDIIYVFGLAMELYGILPGITAGNAQLSHDMLVSWYQFSKMGEMEYSSNQLWTQAIDRQHLNETSVSYLSLDPNNYHMVDNYWKETCDQLWKPILKAHY